MRARLPPNNRLIHSKVEVQAKIIYLLFIYYLHACCEFSRTETRVSVTTFQCHEVLDRATHLRRVHPDLKIALDRVCEVRSEMLPLRISRKGVVGATRWCTLRSVFDVFPMVRIR